MRDLDLDWHPYSALALSCAKPEKGEGLARLSTRSSQSYPMVRPRGKSRSTPSTPTSPAESFIQKKISSLRCGDVKALAASSIAVASSIGSPSLNKPYEQNATPAPTPVHDAINRESSSRWAADPAWQTAYSTAKMVIEITKESSDMFLPLKAVVGALSLLIKNHDVSLVSVTAGLSKGLLYSEPRVTRNRSKI